MDFNKKRLGTLLLGFTVDRLMVWIIDLWLYPVVLRSYGSYKGGAVMVSVSFFACLFTIWAYDHMKIDWLGMEESKEAAHANETGRKRYVMQVLRFVLISCAFDPFWVVVYMRDGAHQYNGLSKRDWNLFLGSLVLSNGFWIVVTTTSLHAFEDNLGKTMIALAIILMALPILRKKISRAVA